MTPKPVVAVVAEIIPPTDEPSTSSVAKPVSAPVHPEAAFAATHRRSHPSNLSLVPPAPASDESKPAHGGALAQAQEQADAKRDAAQKAKARLQALRAKLEAQKRNGK